MSTDPTPDDRTLAAMRLLITAQDPSRGFRSIYEYSVTACDGHTVSGVPLDPTEAPPLPEGVPYRPGLAGSFAVPVPGSLAYVFFANGNPSKPRLLSFDETLPTSSTVDASGQVSVGPSAAHVQLASGFDLLPLGGEIGRVVRYGDLVSIPVVAAVATGAITGMIPGPNHIAKVSAL